ncbi:MAG TPA: PAS domain S-box protein [Ignavibacteriaceae bacterium]|nr:PAS domain S-box protein [Ignavibacteriaceae bacterium]
MNFAQNIKSWFSRLRVKFTISASIITAFISITIFFYFSQRFEDERKNAFMDNAEVGLKSIALASGFELSSGISAMDESINSQLSANRIVYMVITDTGGTIIRSYNLSAAEKYKFKTTQEKEKIEDDKIILRKTELIILKNHILGQIFLGYSLTKLNNEIGRLKISVGIVSVILFIINIFLVSLISSMFTRPIDKITRLAEMISKGNLSQRIKYSSNDELKGLTKAFDFMAMNLEQASGQIDNLNKQIKNLFRDKVGELNLEINQRKMAEFSMRQSEEHFRLLFELAPIGMVINSPEGKILKVNKAFCETVGYSETELIGKDTESLIYPDDILVLEKLHKDLIDEIHPNIYIEKRFLRKDGDIIYAIAKSVLVRDDEGEPLHFIDQIIDISQRKKVEKELLVAKEKAEESDRLKTAFLAQMSHEIRTPLNIILNATPLLADEAACLNKEKELLLEAVNSSGKRLLRTIDLILNMSSVQAGNYKPNFEVIQLDKILCELVRDFQSLSVEKNISISFLNESKNSDIKADKYTLIQIFQNLIGNAVKYTKRGSVAVKVYENKGDKICVDVKDTGIGMSKEYQANLFSPFSQENVGYKREFEGNGLGLALVKKYVDINNSEIKVSSEKDKGSVFTVIFPKNQI